MERDAPIHPQGESHRYDLPRPNTDRGRRVQSETLTPPADGHDPHGQIDPSVHGTTGPLLTSLPGNVSVLDARVLQTTAELAAEFPFNVDMNGGQPLGVGWLQSTIGSGVRSSAATAFLGQDVLGRGNLDILIGTRVMRLLQTGTGRRRSGREGGPVFLGVELAQEASGVSRWRPCMQTTRHISDWFGVSGPRIHIEAEKEVILSAGTGPTLYP